jgi:limonene-1,2-epoxide hydrolase
MTPEQTIRDFCATVPARDIPALVAYFTDDAVYHNMPVEPVMGRDAIRETLEQFIAPATKAEFAILALAVSGSTVLTERVDRFVIAGKKIDIPVMGAFEVNSAGKIYAWRDYFDMAAFMRQMG